MTDNPGSLHKAWLDAVPEAFRMFMPLGGQPWAAGANAGATKSTGNGAADHMGQAADLFGRTLTQLYQAYLPMLGAGGQNAIDAVPEAFRMFMPFGSTAASAPKSAAPFPANHIGDALDMLGRTLPQLYQAYLPLLGPDGLSAKAIETLADAYSTKFGHLLAILRASASTAANLAGGKGVPTMADTSWLPPMLRGLLGTGADGAAAGTSQLQLGLERTFGGLSDAFGLRPSRDLENAWREMLAAGAAKQLAQVEYLALVVQAWDAGTRGLLKDLQARGQRGERVESLLEFLRLWARAVDAPMHDTMQGERGLEVTAKLVRAATQYREQLRKAVGLMSDALFVPTRDEMDDAYREIQALKREVRRLRKLLPAGAKETDA